MFNFILWFLEYTAYYPAVSADWVFEGLKERTKCCQISQSLSFLTLRSFCSQVSSCPHCRILLASWCCTTAVVLLACLLLLCTIHIFKRWHQTKFLCNKILLGSKSAWFFCYRFYLYIASYSSMCNCLVTPEDVLIYVFSLLWIGIFSRSSYCHSLASFSCDPVVEEC